MFLKTDMLFEYLSSISSSNCYKPVIIRNFRESLKKPRSRSW